MRTRYTASGNQTITWDAENRPISISSANGTATFVYDGDGNRILKTEGGITTLYPNRYFEKNLTSGDNTTYYYLGGKMVALKKASDNITFVYQDHLSGTAVTDNGTVSTITFTPWGTTRSGDVPTDKKFTGQILDSTGLYFYNARYYDATIGRFISADSLVPNPINPQAINRYAYCLNNPLLYSDPSGHGDGAQEALRAASTIPGWGLAAAIILLGMTIVTAEQQTRFFSKGVKKAANSIQDWLDSLAEPVTPENPGSWLPKNSNKKPPKQSPWWGPVVGYGTAGAVVISSVQGDPAEKFPSEGHDVTPKEPKPATPPQMTSSGISSSSVPPGSSSTPPSPALGSGGILVLQPTVTPTRAPVYSSTPLQNIGGTIWSNTGAWGSPDF